MGWDGTGNIAEAMLCRKDRPESYRTTMTPRPDWTKKEKKKHGAARRRRNPQLERGEGVRYSVTRPSTLSPSQPSGRALHQISGLSLAHPTQRANDAGREKDGTQKKSDNARMAKAHPNRTRRHAGARAAVPPPGPVLTSPNPAAERGF